MENADAPRDLSAVAFQAMRNQGLEPEFPADAIQQVQDIPGAARAPETAARNLCHLLWCSIDNDHSLDLDQLTVAERLPEGRVKILIAIADVDALVPRATPIDRHAAINTTSVYTAAVIFPMLPEKLSTDLTSLNENQDRLAVVIEMLTAANGIVEASTIYRATVRNRAKLAYRSVAAWLDGRGPIPEKIPAVPGLEQQLRLQDEIAQALRKTRILHGALNLELIQPEAVLSDGQVVDLRQERQNRAQQMIEDFMIAANSTSAQFLEKRGWPSFRRIVRSPERWDRIREVAQRLGEQLPDTPDSAALSAFLAKRRQADPLRFPDLSLTVVKLLGSGEYTVRVPEATGSDANGSEGTRAGENGAGGGTPGHFGLAVPEYSQTTAPNRRYPDLITQRLLKHSLAGEPVPYTASELTALASHCTAQENAARKVERQVRKSAAALFLSGRVGETFDAIVTGNSAKGTWVRLLKLPVEGKLTVGHDGIDVGDQVQVQLASLNVERGFIDFVRSQ